MKTLTAKLCSGISRTKAFEEKGLAQYAVNIGLKCGHACTYCSSDAMLRIQLSKLGIKGSNKDCCVVDPDTPTRVAQDAKNKRNRGMIQLCTTVDAWAPEAQQYNLGRQCLEAILSEPGWKVRILTKNAAVAKDFDFIEKYRDRVLVGLSITATPGKSHIVKITEPNASSIEERLETMKNAHNRGLRTYGMLCPLLPGIADSPAQADELVKYLVDCGVEEIFAEAVNPRGRGLIQTQQALETAGFYDSATAIRNIRDRHAWSAYVVCLIKNIQQSVRKYYDISKLRFLQYPNGLSAENIAEIKKDDAGVVWL
ncbi:MAG TPA: radical SAM protein [Anaerohalosphaeraceae bacterium]|nr:radical SAM protein [Anaerohalosphaeraceae bacterium]